MQRFGFRCLYGGVFPVQRLMSASWGRCGLSGRDFSPQRLAVDRSTWHSRYMGVVRDLRRKMPLRAKIREMASLSCHQVATRLTDWSPCSLRTHEFKQRNADVRRTPGRRFRLGCECRIRLFGHPGSSPQSCCFPQITCTRTSPARRDLYSIGMSFYCLATWPEAQTCSSEI